jgi:hypothetical protein
MCVNNSVFRLLAIRLSLLINGIVPVPCWSGVIGVVLLRCLMIYRGVAPLRALVGRINPLPEKP